MSVIASRQMVTTGMGRIVPLSIDKSFHPSNRMNVFPMDQRIVQFRPILIANLLPVVDIFVVTCSRQTNLSSPISEYYILGQPSHSTYISFAHRLQQ